MKKPAVGKAKQAVVAGWREWVSLPDLGVEALKAKLDTGARTSALHAEDIQPFEHDGERRVRFRLHPAQRSSRHAIACEARVVSQRAIRSSSGETEERYVIKTSVRLGERSRRIEITLTNRDEMGFRMLLGRSAMTRWLIVDPAKSFVLGEKPGTVKKEYARRETGT